jgi:hypothetical protein
MALCLPRPGLEVEDLLDRARIDDPLGGELHELVHDLAPAVMDLGVPQAIPGGFVVDLRVEEQHRIALEDRHVGDALALDLGDELGPDVVVVALVLGQRAGLQPHRECLPDHRCSSSFRPASTRGRPRPAGRC